MRNCVGLFAAVLLFVGSLSYVTEAAEEQSAKGGLINPFFAMDTATDRKSPAKAQAEMVKELGYAGIGCDINLMPAMLKAADEVGTKLFSVYVGANVDPAKTKYDPKLKDVIQSLKGRGTIIWLFITGGKPSSTESDERAVEIVREVADLAAESGLRVALYPHTGFYIQHVDDAIRLAKKADRRNVGVTFNLCHWLRTEDENNLEPLLKRAMPLLYLVTINGADSGGKDWNTLIQTLDRGTFDNARLLTILRNLGYTGPIGFQGYGLKSDARDNLKRTIDTWQKLSARVAVAKD